ncbi:cytochrome P450 3A41 isoform X2 [Dermacentor silvarum]|uniref:cytochrome P450 3A41 isoform X2 n=1 Tax=Dermacentor silvarum TaxID=543639 RepID=UPI002100BDF3|nr:cytochrome P450 3A41 isoform X2 [Dermacentor silvarum]
MILSAITDHLGFREGVFSVVFLVTVIYIKHLYRYKDYWKKQNVVHEELQLFWHPIARLLEKPIHEIDMDKQKKYGKIFGAFEGPKPTLIVSDPNLVKLVLVKSFQSLPDRRMNELIQDCAQTSMQHLLKVAEGGKELNAKEFFGHYALDVIARCAFGTKLNSHTDQTNEFVSKARTAFNVKVTLPVILFFYICGLFPIIMKLLKLRFFGSDTFIFFKNVCLNMIEKRKLSSKKHQDFLQLMVDAQVGGLQGSCEVSHDAEDKLYNLGTERAVEQTADLKALNEDEALAQCVTFFTAGQDTTSSVIAHTAYLLALHPEVQQRLREGVDDCFKRCGGEPSFDDISKLKYLNCIVSESLRLYPPAVRVERTACEDVTLGDTGFKLPKECIVQIPIYAMHRDPEYFPDPEKFDPERFSEENIGSIQPYSYLPFGAGPRNCIGMRFALHVVKTCLFHLVHNVELVQTQSTQVPLKMVKSFGLLTAEDIIVGVKKTDF